MNDQFTIIAKELSKSYEKVKALDAVTFEVRKNEIFGFIGPDGAGKTTLFRILATLIIADEGSAYINGYDIIKNYRKIRNNIGYMPGRFSLYQDLSVEENLSFFATIFGTTIAENYDLIKGIYSHIEPFKKRKTRALSGGMKQKLALSCALIHKPKVLILDEPTTGIDAVSRKEFWEMLKELQQKEITIIISTSYMDEAGLCDRVALIQEGKIMSIDYPENIINQFDKELFAIRAGNMYRLILDLRKYPHADNVYLFGQFVHYTDKTEKVTEKNIYHYLKNLGHQNIEINRVKASIEDCFMLLMGLQ